MGDIDAIQIARAAPAPRSNPPVSELMKNVGLTELMPAFPVLTLNPPAPASLISNLDHLPIPDEDLASVPTACQYDILAILSKP